MIIVLLKSIVLQLMRGAIKALSFCGMVGREGGLMLSSSMHSASFEAG